MIFDDLNVLTDDVAAREAKTKKYARQSFEENFASPEIQRQYLEVKALVESFREP